MLNFIIKTHQKNTVYKGNQIFILNKGMNSGKPQKEPFTNSFVIQFPNGKDAENIVLVGLQSLESQILAPIAYWIRNSFFTSSRFQKGIFG